MSTDPATGLPFVSDRSLQLLACSFRHAIVPHRTVGVLPFWCTGAFVASRVVALVDAFLRACL